MKPNLRFRLVLGKLEVLKTFAIKLNYALLRVVFLVFMGKTNEKNRLCTNCSICAKKLHKIQVRKQ